MGAKNRISAAAIDRLDRLDLAEIGFVRTVVCSSQGPILDRLTKALTTLSNGWMYAIALWPLIFHERSRVTVMVALLCLALSFVPYYLIKPSLARLRPFQRHPELDRGIVPLDQFSCPSGHVMSAIAFGLPLAYSYPPATLAVAAVILFIGWARIAVGHHYPSDLLLGLIVGFSVALPISALLL